ncbi:MAG: hypothetical protein LBH32_14130 [Dysgonamonadaceae bacterium]|jgi:hypothetical protein|nr:hypothetical protein [Dysgonamonadaceae bacterium]
MKLIKNFETSSEIVVASDVFVDDTVVIVNISAQKSQPLEWLRTDAYSESIIRKFVLYPNPNSGVFTIDVELSKASPIRLRIMDVASGGTVSDIRLQGRQEYSVPYSLLTTASAYCRTAGNVRRLHGFENDCRIEASSRVNARTARSVRKGDRQSAFFCMFYLYWALWKISDNNIIGNISETYIIILTL